MWSTCGYRCSRARSLSRGPVASFSFFRHIFFQRPPPILLMANSLLVIILVVLQVTWCVAFMGVPKGLEIRKPTKAAQKWHMSCESADRRKVLSRAVSGFCALAVQLWVDDATAGNPYGTREPIPPPEVQKRWGTRMGYFTRQEDGFDEVREDIVKLVTSDRTLGPALVRLAFHSSGTYDRVSKTGGSSKGTIRFASELKHEANAGLDRIVALLEPVKQRHPAVSYADLYTLAGAVTVEALGGPPIAWRGGRVDSREEAEATPDGRLPEADKGRAEANVRHLRGVFGRMGFSDQEIVALSGAHNLGKCHYQDSGYEGEWSETPWKFDNSYFNILLHPVPSAADAADSLAAWEPQTLPNGKVQYSDPLRVYIMLPTDLALLQDRSMARWVELYARNSPRFFDDFAAAFSKLLALGT